MNRGGEGRWGLTMSAPKSTITLFTPQFKQLYSYPHVTLNNSLLPLEKRPHILELLSKEESFSLLKLSFQKTNHENQQNM